MPDITPTRPRTRVVPEGRRFQARYYDPAMRLWFDLGDPRDTEQEARNLAAGWDWSDPTPGFCSDHYAAIYGYAPDMGDDGSTFAPGVCTTCGLSGITFTNTSGTSR